MQSFSARASDDDAQLRRMSPPENEVPVAVPIGAVLARSESSAVTLTGVQVYSTGVALHVGVRCRPEALAGVDGGLHDLLWAGRRGRTTAFMVGLEFADGRRASNLPRRLAPGERARPGLVGEDAGPDAVLFDQGGGSSSQLSADQSWWLSPVPPDGPLRLVVRCDLLELPETVTELDGTAIRAAAADVVTLWPWVSPREAEPPQPPALDVPADSWFAGR